MISQAEEAALVALCNNFINAGDEINLADLLEHVNTTIPDRDSQEWQNWTKHMDDLNEVWTRNRFAGEGVPWPQPPCVHPGAATADVIDISESQDVSPQPPIGPTVKLKVADGNWEDVAVGSLRERLEKIRADRKLSFEGGQGVGAARQVKSSEARKPGKPRDALVDNLVIEVKEVLNGGEKERHVVYCVNCLSKAVGRNPMHIKAHAKDCGKFAMNFPRLFADTIKILDERSHSTKLEKAGIKLDAPSAAPSTSGNNADPPAGTLLTYMKPARLTETQVTYIEWLLFRMFICCALPWALLNNVFFVAFVNTLAPNFTVPDRSSFFPRLLSHEVSAWTTKFTNFLADKQYLTLSLDGWSTRAKDEVYTFHTTTSKRRSFFVKGHHFKGELVTGDALLSLIVELMTTYEARKFSAIAGDGGPNIRCAKRKAAEMFPWLINIYDPCHNLSLYMKDVGKLFQPMLTVAAAIANYFGKSNYGTFHLDEERKVDKIAEGIKSHTETRFSSSYYQVVSVNTCMPPIKRCVSSGKLKFDTPATKKLLPYIKDGTQHWKLMSEMNSFIHLLSSGANGILTLEGSTTTCADVFYVWVCIAFQLEIVLASPLLDLSSLRTSVIKIYNHRFEQMMKESSHNIFLLAYYLHPVFRNLGGLQLVMPILQDGETLSPDKYPGLFITLLTSVLKIFKGDQLRLEDSGVEVVPQLISKFKAYAYNKEPFCSASWTRTTKPLKWWTSLAKDSNARLLSRVAIIIFSISPSEICDERTASRLGWFNAVRRSSMTPEHLIDSAKLYDYYVNGFQDGKSSHQARVHLSKLPTATVQKAPEVHSAPTILDLVNPTNIDPTSIDVAALEQELFEHPDLYNLNETDRVDAELDAGPTITRSSTRFEIAKYIKLDDPQLAALVNNVDTEGPGAAHQPMPVQSAAPAGKPGDWTVETFMI